MAASRDGLGMGLGTRGKLLSPPRIGILFFYITLIGWLTYIIQMTKARTLLVLFVIGVALVGCQDWYQKEGATTFGYNANEGSMYRHIHATTVYYYNAAPVPTSTPVLGINKTMPIGAFDPTQKISYATALNYFDIKNYDTAANELMLYVANITINAARSQFTLFTEFKRNEVATFSTYNAFGYNVLFIGSMFNVPPGPLAGGFARNSKLVDVTDTAAEDAAQFDFSGTTGETSPFAFQPTAATSGCGIEWLSNTNVRAQILGCVKPILVTFLSGFLSEYKAIGDVLDISSFAIQDKSKIQPAVAGVPYDIVPTLQTTAGNTEYIYQSGPNDPIVGPTIRINRAKGTNTLKRLQASMVLFTLKTFPANYPVNSPDSYIVAVGGTNYAQAFASIPAAPTAIIDGLIAGGATKLDLQKYNPVADTNMGHQFCGLTSLTGTKSQLKYSIAANAAAMDVNVQEAVAPGAAEYSAAACILVASTASCTNTQKLVVSPTYTATTTATGVTIKDDMLTTPTATNKPLYTTTFSPLPASTTTETILKSYTVPAGRSELVFYPDIVTTPPIDSTHPVTYYVTINGVQYPVVTLDAAPQAGAAPIVIHAPAGSVVTTNLTVVTSAATSLTAAEAMYYYDNVVLDGACVKSCPDVVNKTTGVAIDSNPPVCLYCDTTVNLVYTNGKCACKDHYFLDPATQICSPCTDPLCATCNTAPVCTACVGNATLTLGGNNICTCDSGFYRNGTTCVPCPIGCAVCTGPNDCSVCRDSANATGFVTRYNETMACKCLPGFFDVNTTAVCQPCNPLCQTCSGSANNCTSCNASLNLVASQSSCICDVHYYLLNNACVQCSPICNTCDVSSVYCTSCPSLRVLSGTTNPAFKTCKCNATAGLIELDYVCVDALCLDIDPFCSQCEIDATGLRIRSCTKCRDNRIVVSGKCVCQPGFFQGPNNTCVACGAGCQSCQSATVCNTCATSAAPNGDGTCTCRPGTTLVTFTNALYCQPCDYNCAACSKIPGNCTACKAGFSLSSSNTCVCPAATFTSPDGTQCFPCPANCKECSTAGCSVCQTNYIIDTATKQCALSCPDGKFNAGSECRNCPAGCATCYSEIVCSSCLQNYFMFAGQCKTVCPDGSFGVNGQCVRCPAECKTCSSSSVCNSCAVNYVLLAGRCVGDCPVGTYYADGSCRACDSSCKKCTGAAGYCVECPDTRILYNNACYATCPVATVNGVCTNICPGGTYLSGTTCANCDAKCRTCSVTATNCTSCTSGLSSNGICIDTCPTGSMPSNGFCITCDTSCRTCQGTPFSCNECADGYIRSGANCIKSCGTGYYVDPATSACAACPLGCKSCTSATQCSECIDPTTVYVNGLCQKSCPVGATLMGGACVCAVGYLHQATCITACPEGFYPAADKTCALCRSPCLGCTGSATNCISCVAGYSIDAATRTCVASSGDCGYGAYRNMYGNCAPVCDNGYFHNGGCYFECPSNFQPNGFRACVQAISPTFCQPPTFLQGNSCVNNCQAGFWQNTATRTCDRCFTNCASCLSATYCVSCVAGFTPNADQSACVASSSCAAGQFVYQSTCVAQCPAGWYAPSGPTCVRACLTGLYLHISQNVCYPGCPTPFYTADVCYDVCPAGVQCMRT